ncbi:hypothetical protein IT882_00540 [Microbacterium schleiferi]|uniref:DUF4435 domain-containing protein n=1 Tax=Microbacterium schleiferi TaxID=69362 RepID=A0A7S8RH27_9MICO|nr:hypothetical protein [Microbacterium schleiferi]QPE04696.1 hypothetical protein IT882_00540 [Microbacterium schleiferi]
MTIIVDEPERHLHRSISAGLVEAVIAARPDCAFVVLTHDLDLAATLAARGDVYSLSGCTWKESAVFSWDLREVPRGESLPEVTRRALLGGRREVMFIEGDAASIDLSLYRLLFPEWTCSPVGGCEAVIKSVTGIRASEGFHWVHAVGLVDGDGRSPEERDSLYRRGVLSLPVNEIESLYYLPAVVQSVARAQADLLGESSEALASRGKAAFLKALGEAGTLERLARKMARDEVNRKLADHIPGAIGDENIEISIPSPYPKVLSNLQEMLARRDYEGMVKTVSIRDSAARVLTARAMEFASIVMYERAARARIAEDDDLRAVVRATLGTLPV